MACTVLKEKDLIVISPIIKLDSGNTYEWFLRRSVRENCLPHAFSFSAMNVETSVGKSDVFDAFQQFNKSIYQDELYLGNISEDANYIKNIRHVLKRHIAEAGCGEIALRIDEWNNSFWFRDLTNDTCFKSCYIFKNILENLDDFNSMSLLYLSDQSEELITLPERFSGGAGIFTWRGVGKASYNAYVLLAKMGDMLLDSGDGYCIIEDMEKKALQIFLYNYTHYDKLYCRQNSVNYTLSDRYKVFNEKSPLHFSIAITGLSAGKHRVKTWSVSRKAGSAYDEWIKMGAPQIDSRDVDEYLIRKSCPEEQYGVIQSNGEKTIIDKILYKHDIMLIEIELES